jgi:hypothetical protein
MPLQPFCRLAAVTPCNPFQSTIQPFSPVGRSYRRPLKNPHDWICRTTFRKTKSAQSLFLLPGGEGQDEGGQNIISILLFTHPHKLKLELQL